jgi:chromosome segregation ATPase
MSFGNFLKHFGKGKIEGAASSLQDAIVGWDPEGATEAAISQMEENFDNINREFSKVKQDWHKEQLEADTIVALYNQRLAAAEHLQCQVTAGGSGSKKAEAGLVTLLGSLEEMQADVEIEKSEAVDAKSLMNELQQTVDMYAEKLKNSRRDIKKASNTMARAKRQEERAEATAQRAAEAAGISKSANGLGSALESMQRQANEASANADAANRKAQLLGPTVAEDNDAVKAAMAAVSGESAGPTSIADRLAALKQ